MTDRRELIPRICVTGAAGFVAGHIITKLLQDGQYVHGTVRDLGNDDKRSHLDALVQAFPGRLELFEADMLRPGSLDSALTGCDALIHTAARVILAARDPQHEIIDVAVEGTRNVLDSVSRTPTLQRIVMTSSIAAIMSFGQPGTTFTEDDWCTSDDLRLDPYGMAKVQSERLLWEFVAEHADRVQAVAINPAVVIGRPLAKHHIKSSVSFIRDLVGWNYPGCTPMSLHLIDAEDVADAHVRALTSEQAAGKRIILAERCMSMLDISRILSRHYVTPLRRLPAVLVYVAAIFDKRFSFRLARASVNYEYSFASDHARELLGLHLKNTELSILECAEAMVTNHWVEPRSSQ